MSPPSLEERLLELLQRLVREVPFVFGDEPIVGWRAWGINGSRLCSSSNIGWVWPAGRAAEAHCIYNNWPAHAGMIYSGYPGRIDPDHESPSRGHGDCLCGFWAAKSPGYFSGFTVNPSEGVGDRVSAAVWRRAVLIGRVALWGRFVEHEHGWRAQYAYPVDMAFIRPLSPSYAQTAEAISERYGVPVWLDAEKAYAGVGLAGLAPKTF